MEYKKRIFIGSSTESIAIGEKIKGMLEERGYECRLWNGDFFEYGHSYIEDLVKKIIAYDYAIMIGGPDDEVIRHSDGTRKMAPRDNIYLEYGLFSGVISPYRTLLLKSKKCAVASDLHGITLLEFDESDEAVASVRKWITQREDVPSGVLGREHIELLPTVGIAVGYYDNFLSRFKERFAKNARYSDVKLTVYIPDYVTTDCNDYVDKIILRHQLVPDTVEDLRLLVTRADDRILDAYDVPGTIKAIFKTVDYIWGVVGDTEDMKRAKIRALDNFANNLQILMNGSEWFEDHVKIARLPRKMTV